MSTSAERQRKRRARLKSQGIVDVTVPVPLTHIAALRHYARQLCDATRDPAPPQHQPGPIPRTPAPAPSDEPAPLPEPQQAEKSKLDKVMAALEAARADLGKYGVQRVGVYGPVVHADERSDRHIKIVIALKSGQINHAITKLTINSHIERVLRKAVSGATIDITEQATMTPDDRAQIDQKVVYAF